MTMTLTSSSNVDMAISYWLVFWDQVGHSIFHIGPEIPGCHDKNQGGIKCANRVHR